MEAAECPIAIAMHAEKVDEYERRPWKRHPSPGYCRSFRWQQCHAVGWEI